jgi:hypothetical protein
MIKWLTRARFYKRCRGVADFAIDGRTQLAISRDMNIPQATVSRDRAARIVFRSAKGRASAERQAAASALAAMRAIWREFPISDFTKMRLERLRKINLMTFITQSADVAAQCDDVAAHEGRVCAMREFVAESDVSSSQTEVCRGFWCICDASQISLKSVDLSDASPSAAETSSERENNRRSRAEKKMLRICAMKGC